MSVEKAQTAAAAWSAPGGALRALGVTLTVGDGDGKPTFTYTDGAKLAAARAFLVTDAPWLVHYAALDAGGGAGALRAGTQRSSAAERPRSPFPRGPGAVAHHSHLPHRHTAAHHRLHAHSPPCSHLSPPRAQPTRSTCRCCA
jgi:hypothetical protein